MPPARRCTRCAGSKRAPSAAGSCRRQNPENARKQWIAGALRPSGAITIDAGALKALRSGKSLLPAGVTAVTGRFARGDTVSVLEPDGAEFARGMIAYNDREAVRIIGKRSGEIEGIVGFRGRAEMIHRDDLVIMRADSRLRPDAGFPT